MTRHLHLGLGRFHRAHQAVYLNNKGVSITAFSMRRPDEARALSRAGHRYRVVVLDGVDSVELEIESIDEALYLGDSRERCLELLASPEITTVTLTITEKGYQNPVVADLLLDGMARRRTPVNILSCDNLRANGDFLRRVCEERARQTGRSLDLGRVSFPNSMVDRIVPAGDDPLTIETEAFHQWVIEDDFLGQRPDWEQPGLTFAKDVKPFEQLKLSLLNASHSFMAYEGQLQGYTYVHEAIRDPGIRSQVERLYFQEVGPLLEIPEPWTLKGYGDSLVQRFHNTALPHRLEQIAMDGTQKIPQRFLPHLKESAVLQTALEAWFRYTYEGLKFGKYVVSDPKKEGLKDNLQSDFESTKKAWSELLGW